MKIIKNFPNFRQVHEYDCGPQALQSILAYYGIDVSESALMKLAGTHPKTGTDIAGLEKVPKDYGLEIIAGKMEINNLKKYINRKIPVILLIQAWASSKKVSWENNWANGHYAVAIGYDSKKIYFEDPASIYITSLTYIELEKRWHGFNNRTNRDKYFNYGMAVYGKKPVWSQNKIIKMN